MDNFDLKKFLKESKALENLNPTIKNLNEGMSNKNIRAKIKEMIVAELEGEELEDATKKAEKGDSTDLALHMAGVKEETAVDMMDPIEEYEDYELEDRKVKYGIDPEKDDEDYSDYFFDIDTPEEDLEEAKKKKDEEVEDTETIDTTIEDLPVEDEVPAEDAPEATGGLEDLAADMKGTEADLMDYLMKAFQIAKGMNNEKLETQVGNTLKFFVSEYIGGGEG
jgi:hypothetical protein